MTMTMTMVMTLILTTCGKVLLPPWVLCFSSLLKNALLSVLSGGKDIRGKAELVFFKPYFDQCSFSIISIICLTILPEF